MSFASRESNCIGEVTTVWVRSDVYLKQAYLAGMGPFVSRVARTAGVTGAIGGLIMLPLTAQVIGRTQALGQFFMLGISVLLVVVMVWLTGHLGYLGGLRSLPTWEIRDGRLAAVRHNGDLTVFDARTMKIISLTLFTGPPRTLVLQIAGSALPKWRLWSNRSLTFRNHVDVPEDPEVAAKLLELLGLPLDWLESGATVWPPESATAGVRSGQES